VGLRDPVKQSYVDVSLYLPGDRIDFPRQKIEAASAIAVRKKEPW